MPRIFISYRRADSKWATARLHDYLSQRFGGDNIFMDIDTIGPGEDFVQVISDAIGACDAVLVMIGPQWLMVSDGQDRRRLDDPDDVMRREIASALDQNKLVIPVLIDGAEMPGMQDLPDELAALAQRNALELSEKRFQHDVELLANALESADAPAGRPSDAQPRIPTWLLYAGAVIIISAFLGILLSRNGNSSPPPEPTENPPTVEEQPTPLAPTETTVQEAVEYSPLSDCPPSRLYVGDDAYVSLDAGLNGIRSSSDNSIDNILGMAGPGETMTITGGPECSFGWLMWEVETETGLLGWTPEGDGAEYWLVPGTPNQ